MKPIKDARLQFQGTAAEEQKIWQQKGATLSRTKRHGLDPVENQRCPQGLNHLYLDMSVRERCGPEKVLAGAIDPPGSFSHYSS